MEFLWVNAYSECLRSPVDLMPGNLRPCRFGQSVF